MAVFFPWQLSMHNIWPKILSLSKSQIYLNLQSNERQHPRPTGPHSLSRWIAYRIISQSPPMAPTTPMGLSSMTSCAKVWLFFKPLKKATAPHQGVVFGRCLGNMALPSPKNVQLVKGWHGKVIIHVSCGPFSPAGEESMSHHCSKSLVHISCVFHSESLVLYYLYVVYSIS